MNEGVQYTLKDNRDGKSYYVSKLKDGNIWMTQNLDHNIVTTANFYTPANTDVPSNWTAGAATSTTSYNGDINLMRSYDPGNLCWNGTLNSSTTVTCNNGANKHYSLGNYYNWMAAVAISDIRDYSVSSGMDMNRSICPAGWTLPKSGDLLTDSGSFEFLVNQQGLTSGVSGNIQNSPAFFSYSGQGNVEGVGTKGIMWSSVIGDGDGAYNFIFENSSYRNPRAKFGRYNGYSVRCVARD